MSRAWTDHAARGIPVPPLAPAYYPGWVTESTAVGQVSMLDLATKNMCALRISWPYGAASEPADRLGITSVALQAAVAGRGGELTRLLDELGAELTASVSPDASAITLVAPTWSLEPAALLAAQAIRRPSYGDDDVAHARSYAAARAGDTLARPLAQAEQALREAIYDDQSGFSHLPVGTPETIRALTAGLVRRHYRDSAHPAGICAYFVGDVVRSRARDVLTSDLFADLSRRRPLATQQPAVTARQPAPRSVLISRTVSQPVLACGQLVWLDSAREVAALELAVATLAGWYGSRWQMRLREREGLSYGVSADFNVRGRDGSYACG